MEGRPSDVKQVSKPWLPELRKPYQVPGYPVPHKHPLLAYFVFLPAMKAHHYSGAGHFEPFDRKFIDPLGDFLRDNV